MGEEEMNILEAVERLGDLHRDVDWYDAVLREMHQVGLARFSGSLNPEVADTLGPVGTQRATEAPEGSEPVEEAWWEAPYSELDRALEAVFRPRTR